MGKCTATRDEILAVLREMPGTAAEVAQDLGISVNAACMALSRMLACGLVRTIGRHQPERGRPARVFIAD